MAAEVVLFLLIFPIVLFLPPVSANSMCTFTSSDSLCTFCQYTSGTYTHNSLFEHNLRGLLRSIPVETSSHFGYNEGMFGNHPDAVYAQALCRGDISPSACKDCVDKASQEVFRDCRSSEAIIWFESCQVHYSSSRFFNSYTYTGKFPPYNDGKKSLTNPNDISPVLGDLFRILSNQSAHNVSRHMFAVGQTQVSGDAIYGLVQCTRDISAGDCQLCLDTALEELKTCCFSRQGGMILSRNCYQRFENFRFYNLSAVDEIIIVIPKRRSTATAWKVVVPAVLAVVSLVVLAGFCILWCRRKKNRPEGMHRYERSQSALMGSFVRPQGVAINEEGELVSTEELPFIDLGILRAATDNFSSANKLGQGGFGSVYEGMLPDGMKVALKRLSRRSWQGMDEFKNEIILIAKLRHRNLVRLVGCSLDGEEKILVYEFMPNKSLDLFISDAEKRAELNWKTRYSIISGIARGLLYLHEDSRLTIIHRDLKPSNVLLDHEMVAKISDFGMARIFCANQDMANTKRIVGTFGYMSPEYAMQGSFSVKSDVFSFGVILLEIISGKRNSGFYLTEHAQTLLAYLWRLWNEGKELEFVDSLMPEPYPISEVIRCMHIGLLCVQENPADRPIMSYVVSVLSSEATTLPEPSKTAVSVGRHVNYDQLFTADSSVNELTMSSISAR